ncbi:unnamed protein product [Kuraishia capsulata CBS 1993]|uniref:CinA C-terminal domain-containing protein n=1 Tax=Kuraishia capsulata CBS 1993 TaxID=1382522 RepID=W6MIL7_9ASCO|nr:uncharacterized protein KUCA_T00000172001 [Kuraishia capsulata CBS 1993]CDK24212.1 unnamed protein product [Kuraishia capsulata CBS 1993]
MSFPPDDLKELLERISNILIRRNETIAVSEGACGGLLAAYLVSIPGASKFFDGGRLLYSLKSRLRLSGWDSKDISLYTVPSESGALKMARNLRIELGSTYVLSETGIAGPSHSMAGDGDGSLSQNSIDLGTVYFGFWGPNGEESCTMHTGLSERSQNMQQFARLGLQFLLSVLEKQ